VRKSRFLNQSSESSREDAKREAEAVMRELRPRVNAVVIPVVSSLVSDSAGASAARWRLRRDMWSGPRRRIRPARGRWAMRSGCLKVVGHADSKLLADWQSGWATINPLARRRYPAQQT
jgi:hypothetical protein